MYNDDNDDDKDDNNGMGLYQLKRMQEDKSKPTLYWKLRLAGERKWGFKSYNMNAVNQKKCTAIMTINRPVYAVVAGNGGSIYKLPEQFYEVTENFIYSFDCNTCAYQFRQKYYQRQPKHYEKFSSDVDYMAVTA